MWTCPKFKSKTQKIGIDLVAGVDGGGTRTRAVVTDSRGRVIGSGAAGPANPLRVGYTKAARAVNEAVEQACRAAQVEREQIAAAEIGLAGVRNEAVRERMREALGDLGIEAVDIVTDADIALFGATDGAAGIVIIAGTGSVCYGRSAGGSEAWAGGWGPLAGDEGSGAWLARRALERVAQALDGRGQQTILSQAACEYFQVQSTSELPAAIYAPEMTNDRLAGFGKHVIESAANEDQIANELLGTAGRELGKLGVAVIRNLGLEEETFRVAHVGGVFAAGELVLAPLREAIHRVAPHAQLIAPQLAPAVAAARMARRSLDKLALAG